MTDEARFLEILLSSPTIRTVLERVGDLAPPDWWLTGGAVFQTVWNALDGRSPDAGILDHDVFYFDAGDLTAAAEAEVGRRVAAALRDVGIRTEVVNEARVHLWYEAEHGVPGRRFSSSRDAIDHFAAIVCCYGVTRHADGRLEVYAPHGYADLFARRVRPNPRLVTRDAYEAKARRWRAEWPSLAIEPWTAAPVPGRGPALSRGRRRAGARRAPRPSDGA